MDIKPGDLVKTRHGDVVRVVEFVENVELPMWRCDNGTVYIEEDLTSVGVEGEDGERV